MKRQAHCVQKGQGLVEYALIILGIALLVILVLSLLGVQITDVFCQVSGALGGQGCSAAQCAYAFDDRSDLEGWSGRDVEQNFSINEGKLCNSGTQMNYFDGCENEKVTSDFTVNLKGVMITRNSGDFHSGFDFVFRTDENGNGYWLTYTSKSNVLVFWKQVQGVRIMLKNARVPAEWGQQAMDFKLEVKGDTFTVYVEDEIVIQARDDAYDAGTFGWRNKPGSITCIDEMSFE